MSGLRRAGFGATFQELEAYCAKGYEATVEELLHPERPPGIEEDLRPLGGKGPCPDDIGRHLAPRKRLLDSEFDTRAPVLSAVVREERGLV